MATVTYNNGVGVLPSIGDFAEIYKDLVVSSATATTIVLENAFGKITLTAEGANPFAYSGTQVPTGGKVAAIDVDVYSQLGALAPLYSLSYAAGTEPLANSFFNYYGQTAFTGPDTIFQQADTLTGSGASDWLQGRNGADALVGGAGDDTLDGGYGSDQMTGGTGDDVYLVDTSNTSGESVIEAADEGRDTVVVLGSFNYTMAANVENLEVAPLWAYPGYVGFGGRVTGNDLNNIMRGNNGGDQFQGGAGNDRLFGNGYSDTLDGGLGNDTMFGGDGDDTFVVDAAGDRVVESSVPAAVNGSTGIDMVIASVNYTLTANVENLTLSGTSDINGTGNTLDNRIFANNGNNVLDGREGNDTLSYLGTVGALTVALNTTAAQATGGSGTDTVRGFENLVGGNGNDSLTGNAGANRLDGSYGADTLVGLLGDDVYIVDNTGDTLVDSGGTDLVDSLVSWTLAAGFENLNLNGYTSTTSTGVGNAGANVIRGSDGNNLLQGLGGSDTIYGGMFYGPSFGGYGGIGDDTLDGGAGADTMQGGYGNDTYIVDNVGDVVVEAFEYGYTPVVDTVRSSINYVLPEYVENLVLTGTAVRGAGNILNNVITANDADNVLNGGRGNDTVSYEGTTAAVSVTLGVVGAQATGGSGSDSIRNFENITGGAGNDTLTGYINDNILNGGGGDDSLTGGKGNDTYVVNSAGDIVVEAANAGTDTVQTTVAYTLSANVENIQIVSQADCNATGNALGNHMLGNGYANLLEGLDGNDTLEGGYGNDTLLGGAGDDTYLLISKTGTQITDTAGIDTVRLDYLGYSPSDGPYVLPDSIENLELFSSNLYGTGYYSAGTGNALDNRLVGASQKNTLNGLDGNDTLVGGIDSDTLTGGAGNDVFLFDTPLYAPDFYNNLTFTGIDTITDFTVGVDRIQIDDDAFPGLPLGAGGAFLDTHLVIGTAATSAEDRIIYDSGTGNLFYDPDGNGAQAQVQFAQLQAGLALTAADFLIV